MTQLDLLRRVIEFLEACDITYMIVGSYASSAHGEPRMTRDIDIVVKFMADDIGPLRAAFPEPDFYLSKEAARDAIHSGGMFNLIHGASGNKVDFMIARTDMWGRTQIARRERRPIFADREAYVAQPEDVIISKLLYYKANEGERHLRDIAGILRVSGERVEHAYIEQWAKELEVEDIWHAVLRRVARPD